ncbi:MAG: Nramp family divalent metal transporter [Thermoleophilia bacterium]|nr:Nramp family divalent metal transporter [Thermoleophilia bacterium]
MVSSVGSGSILFTPRVGSRYGYELLWAALLVAFLTWVIIREIGRYTVVSGRSILEGYYGIPGPRGWIVWLIFLPGLASGIVVVAGIAALIGSALGIVLPERQAYFAVGIILVSSALVVSGRYRHLEKVTAGLAAVLIVSTVVTAIVVFPGFGPYAHGLAPVLPLDFDAHFVLPWFGFLLAGAAGMMWYSYWVAARGFGGPVFEEEEQDDEQGKAVSAAGRQASLRSWMIITGTTAAIGVVGATVVNVSFLTLGAELLAPLGIVPEGIRVAEDIARLLSDVWGPAGTWVFVTGIFVALWGSVLANQDGWGRMYADATLILLRRRGIDESSKPRRRLLLRNGYVIAVLTAAPVAVYLLLRDPVGILFIGGAISAAHIPVVVSVTLYLNLRRLPRALAPGPVWIAATLAAVLFYAFFTGFYFYELIFR